MKSLKALPVLLACCFFMSAEALADTHGMVLGTALHETPQSACLSRDKAEAQAGELALKTAQTYCRSEGFGWRASSVKDFGNLDCQRCDSGRYICSYLNVSLECRKAGPKLSWAGWFSDRL